MPFENFGFDFRAWKLASARLLLLLALALTALFHVDALRSFDGNYGDAWPRLALLGLTVVAAAALGLTFQRKAVEEASAALNSFEEALLRGLADDIMRARKSNLSAGLLMFEVVSPSPVVRDEATEQSRFGRQIERGLAEWAHARHRVVALGRQRFAVSVSSRAPLAQLTTLSDALQRGVPRLQDPRRGALQVEIGIAVSTGAVESANGLLRKAKGALLRAQALATRVYAVVDDMPQ